MSIEADKIIAVRTGKTIYKDGNTVLKVFDSDYSKSDILNEALNQAHMAQEPIFAYKKDSSGAEDYRQLTNDFLKLCRNLKTN